MSKEGRVFLSSGVSLVPNRTPRTVCGQSSISHAPGIQSKLCDCSKHFDCQLDTEELLTASA